MKIISKEEADAHQRATVVGGAQGFFGGLALALPAAYLANRRFAYYRSLTPALKAFSVITVVVPAFVISAERAGLQFEKDHWTGAGKDELDLEARRERDRWDAMGTGEKIREFAAKHEYGLIGGAWATAMVGSFGYIMRDPYQTTAQKIVQARMWAQGLTVGIVIAAGAMAHSNRTKMGRPETKVDHSWRDIIAAEEAVEKARAEGIAARRE